jgi:hypothetical protein
VTKKNTGITYEKITQKFFQVMLNQEDVTNIDVKQNADLSGKSGAKHQIDVYWEFTAAGVTYRTIVQCKDWNSRVKQEQVLAFKSVLDDLPGQPRGFIVSRAGFQSGARTVAAHHGIVLFELTEAADDFWDGTIRSIHMDIHLVVPKVSNVTFEFDDEWIRAERTALGLEKTEVSVSGILGDLHLISDTGGSIGSVGDVLETALPVWEDHLSHPAVAVRKAFDCPVFLDLHGQPLPRLKVQAISCLAGQDSVTSKVVLDDSFICKYILKNLETNSQHILNEEMDTLRAPQISNPGI